jgi:hypothetical protein
MKILYCYPPRNVVVWNPASQKKDEYLFSTCWVQKPGEEPKLYRVVGRVRDKAFKLFSFKMEGRPPLYLSDLPISDEGWTIPNSGALLPPSSSVDSIGLPKR